MEEKQDGGLKEMWTHIPFLSRLKSQNFPLACKWVGQEFFLSKIRPNDIRARAMNTSALSPIPGMISPRD